MATPTNADTLGMTSKEAAASAEKWLGAISTLTGAAALAATFGISFAPNNLVEDREFWAKILLLASVVLVSLSIVLAALASARIPVKGLWGNPATAKVSDQGVLKKTRWTLIGSQIAAGVAAFAFLFALGLSLFGEKDPQHYLYTENMGTPAAARVLCGELAADPSGVGIFLSAPGSVPVAVTNLEALVPFTSATCPSTDAH